MKYLKSYNESKSSNDRRNEIKVGVLEACFPISKSTMDDICQTLIDEYKIPGVIVGVWIPGKGEWVSALGVADKKTKEKINSQGLRKA